MRPLRGHLRWLTALILLGMGGCSNAPKPVTYLGHADLNYYKDLATKVDYPSKPAPDERAAFASSEPRMMRRPRKDQIWDLSLGEAIKIALRNNKIIRTRDQVQFPRNPLVLNPDQSPSVYDPAVQETGVLFGQRGVEAALSDFDAQFSTNMTWGHNEQLVNNALNSGGIPPGTNLIQDTATFRARLDKTFADSSQISFINEWDYLSNNEPGNLFPSLYTGFARVEFRRPLLAGGGPDYTRIAGPIGRNQQGVAQGVVISRINSDMAIADFEESVHTLVRDVEASYWDLSLAYHNYHAQAVSLKSALKIWQLVKAKVSQGLSGGSSADEAQALDNFYDSQGREQDALSSIYTTEGQFRRLLGLPPNDGRVIRPCDEPTVAELIPDWHMAVAEGITRRPEIRRQKWNIKSLELQLQAACNLVQPRVDFVAGYQVNAFGDVLISQQSNPATTGSSAFASLADAQQTGWNIGFEASIPIGLRNAHTQVRNQEFRLARARAGLATQELDIAHEIRQAFQNLDRTYTLAQSAYNRRIAAQERVKAYEAQYDLRGNTVDPLLRSQQSLAQAEFAWYQALTQYNQAITDFYYRTGTILEEANVSVSEDMWDPHAYSDALRRAWARSHAQELPFLRTAPAEIVTPPGCNPPIVPVSAAIPSALPPSPAGPATEPTPASGLNASSKSGSPASPGPESQPSPPLPTPQPRRYPQAAVPEPAQSPFVQPVANWSYGTTPAGSAPTAPVHAAPVSARPPMSTAAASPSAPSNRSNATLPVTAPAAGNIHWQDPIQVPTSFSTPAPPPSGLRLKSLSSPESSSKQDVEQPQWSMPNNVTPAEATRAANALTEPSGGSADAFDMPLNQLGR